MAASKAIEPSELIGLVRVGQMAKVAYASVLLHAARGRFPTVTIDGRQYVRRADAEKYAREIAEKRAHQAAAREDARVTA